MPTPEELDTAFETLERFAVAGKRAPVTGTHGITTTLAIALCRAGRVLSDVYAHNWRVFEILTGPHAGKRTQAPENPKWRPYMTVGRVTVYHRRTSAHGAEHRPRPSAPRALSRQELED